MTTPPCACPPGYEDGGCVFPPGTCGRSADLFADRGASFSPCGLYRYRLWRTWDSRNPPLVFCMLNPSTADAEQDDPTVARCSERARRLGHGGLEVVNLFALRSTDPKALYGHADPVGPENDSAILGAAERGKIVCAWGNHGRLRGRDKAVLKLLRAAGALAFALKISKDGHPSHPLYLSYDLRPEPYQ